jgi:hypothetical protein
MSLREERALEALVTRLTAITGVPIDVDPEDEHGDLLDGIASGKRIDILTSTTLPDAVENRHQYPVIKRLTLRGLTRAPEPVLAEEDDTPVNRAMRNLRVGYALLQQILEAAWPTGAADGYQDDLGGAAKTFTYAGHDVFGREDGGKTVGVYVDCDIAYVLNLDKPNK